MARVTVTIEGEADEVRDALVRLLGSDDAGATAANGATLGDGVAPPPVVPIPWTQDDMALFWSFLTSPARQVLAEVAQRPGGYAFQDLERALGLDMRRIGGSLSSVGHAMRRLYRTGNGYSRDWPLRGDKNKRVYLMEPEVAGWVQELAGAGGEGMDVE